MDPRDYQVDTVNACHESWSKYQSILVVLPTGMGKTVVFVEIASRWEHGRVLIIAPQIELVSQAAKKLHKHTGIMPAIEQAHNRSNESSWGRQPFIVASKSTLLSIEKKSKYLDKHGVAQERPPQKRYERLQDIGLVIVDEAHDGLTEQFKEIVDHYRKHGAKVLGVTATPKRSDGKSLGIVYEHCAYNMDILSAIEAGWLVAPNSHCLQLQSLDLSQVRTSSTGDFVQKELAKSLEADKVVYEIAELTAAESRGLKTVVYCESILQAQQVAGLLSDQHGYKAEYISSKCTKDKRREVLESFTGDPDGVEIVTNVGILCLDSKTEVLTRRGWVGVDTVATGDKFAAWYSDGRITFEAGEVVVRKRLPNEKMAVLSGSRLDIRVTEGHDFVCRTGKTWFKKPARDLVGKAFLFPVSGLAEPTHFEWPSPEFDRKTLVIKTAYNLRTYNGFGQDESRREAKRRVDLRISRSRVIQPAGLTDAECGFLGFWAGDGTNSQGRVSVAQSKVYPLIGEWITETLNECRLHFTQCHYETHTVWTLASGLGGGEQSIRGGYAHLKPYLQKQEFAWLWALTEQQFDAFIHGLWLADGDHGNGERNTSRAMRLDGTNQHLFEAIQEVAPQRGYRVSARWSKNGPKSTKPICRASLHKISEYTIGNDRVRLESKRRDETVWCVTVPSGAILTRRNGKVAVLGNCTGWDFPGLEHIVIARPTKSLSLYQQMIGRGTRPLEGVVDFPGSTPELRKQAIANSRKPHFKLTDLRDNSLQHKLVSAVDILGGSMDLGEEVDALARKMLERAEQAESLLKVIDAAKEQVAAEVIAAVKDALASTAEARTPKAMRIAKKQLSDAITRAKAALAGDQRQAISDMIAKANEREEELEREERERLAKQQAKAEYKRQAVDPFDQSQRGMVSQPVEGEKAMRFGKHKGKPMSQVPADYLQWAVNSDLPTYLKGSCWAELRRRKKAATATSTPKPVLSSEAQHTLDTLNQLMQEI